MQQERKHRPVDYERAIEAQDREEARVLEAQIQRFTSRLRVKLYHNLERLEGVIRADPMNRRFPC